MRQKVVFETERSRYLTYLCKFIFKIVTPSRHQIQMLFFLNIKWEKFYNFMYESLACHDSWRRKESDTTERLNWTECYYMIFQKWYNFWFDYFHLNYWKQTLWEFFEIRKSLCLLTQIWSQSILNGTLYSFWWLKLTVQTKSLFYFISNW